jgi:hypothetical protein
MAVHYQPSNSQLDAIYTPSLYARRPCTRHSYLNQLRLRRKIALKAVYETTEHAIYRLSARLVSALTNRLLAITRAEIVHQR